MPSERQPTKAIVAGNCLIVGSVFGFLMIALLAGVWWLWTVYGLVGMKTFFRTTQATVLSSEVVFHKGSSRSGPEWEVRLRYRYQVNGRTYEGYRYTPTFGDAFDSQAEAHRVVESLPAGESAAIRYDPLIPSQSAVATRCGNDVLFGLFCVPAFSLLGAVIFWIKRVRALRSGRPQDPRSWRDRLKDWVKSPRTDATMNAPLWVLPLVSLLFMAMGVFIMVTAFKSSEPSQVMVGPLVQVCFGVIPFLVGLAPLGLAINLWGSPHRD